MRPPPEQATVAEASGTVHQAYALEIGLPAVREGRFPGGWWRDRMTWASGAFTDLCRHGTPG
ncbi:DUF4291 family protein [Streptomyces sp. NBC_00285]|uniref:DUF4291 family protein n=1 Tax=Streptomyces sp. NBC_00285 TaxID=2975700 RepID=UPI003FA7492A